MKALERIYKRQQKSTPTPAAEKEQEKVMQRLPAIFEANHMPCKYDFGYCSLDKNARRLVETIIAKQKELIAQQAYEEAVLHFNNTARLTVPSLCGQDYYALVAKYQLALALSFLGQYEQAAQYMNETGTMSAGDREDCFFSEHQYFALYLRQWQEAAISQGKPGIIITALPRSASAFLTYAIAEILDVPVLRASMGSFPHHVVVRNWAHNLSQGGCVTHEHFSGGSENIAQLAAAGVKKVYVQIRDPRATAWSYLHHTAPSYKQRNETVTIEDIVHTEYYPHAIRWIESWLDAQEKFKDTIDIEFLSYNEVVGDIEKILRRMLTARYYLEIRNYMRKTSSPDFKPIHFRTGQKEEWREHIRKELQDTMWDITPDRVKELLKMER